ncbi:MAG: hypothetical protein ABI603_14675 [Acidobacteriota bacterium]
MSAAACAAAMVFGSAVFVGAHEGHEHRIMGTVKMAATDRLTVEDTAGKEVRVKVTPQTLITGRPAVKIEDVKPGTRVVVTAVEEKDKTLTAKRIELGPAPRAGK